MLHIPLYQPDLSGNERAYLLEAFDSGWISSKGRFVAAFESAFVAQHGDAAFGQSMRQIAEGIGAGDEVLVPTLTYVATVNAIRHVGATPVFVDADAQTWQIDVADARRRISPRTRAALAVHLYGGSCDLHALRSLCLDHDLRLIEDCAEAIGLTANMSVAAPMPRPSVSSATRR